MGVCAQCRALTKIPLTLAPASPCSTKTRLTCLTAKRRENLFNSCVSATMALSPPFRISCLWSRKSSLGLLHLKHMNLANVKGRSSFLAIFVAHRRYWPILAWSTLLWDSTTWLSRSFKLLLPWINIYASREHLRVLYWEAFLVFLRSYFQCGVCNFSRGCYELALHDFDLALVHMRGHELMWAFLSLVSVLSHLSLV